MLVILNQPVIADCYIIVRVVKRIRGAYICFTVTLCSDVLNNLVWKQFNLRGNRRIGYRRVCECASCVVLREYVESSVVAYIIAFAVCLSLNECRRNRRTEVCDRWVAGNNQRIACVRLQLACRDGPGFDSFRRDKTGDNLIRCKTP